MTITELNAVAAETLDYFLEVMPDCPFTADDIEFAFATKAKMVETYKELAAKYKEDVKLNPAREVELRDAINGNALIGRNKSGVLIFKHSRNTREEIRSIVIHELAHIYCGKQEGLDSVFNTYGDGNTYDDNPVEKLYDGAITAGHTIWSEFIAEYYALKHTFPKYKLSLMTSQIAEMLEMVSIANFQHSKSPYAYACARFLNATDTAQELASLSEENGGEPEADALFDTLKFLQGQLQREKPWKITMEFVENLGNKYHTYLMHKTVNSGEMLDLQKIQQQILQNRGRD